MQLETQINNSSEVTSALNGQISFFRCEHCRQKLFSKAHKSSGFCCIGCKAAYRFINQLGLDNFYCLRDQEQGWKASPANENKSDFDFYNDPNFQNQFIIKDEYSDFSRLEFQIFGMHCAACVWVLEKIKDVVPGIFEVRVNILTSKACVSFDENLIKPSAVAASLAGLGYKLTPLSPRISLENLSKKNDRVLSLRLGVAAFAAMNVMLLFIGRYQGLFTGMEQKYVSFFAWVSFIISLPAVFYAAVPFYQTSWAALKFKKLHIDLPISIAIVGGFLASAVNTILGRSEIYFDTVTALIFLLLCGRWCQRHALNRASDLSNLIHSFTPLSAMVRKHTGEFKETFTASIEKDNELLIRQDEVVACDGVVVSGSSFVNNSVLSGESEAVRVSGGSEVFAGAVNIGSDLVIKVTAPVKYSRIGKILSDIGEASLSESKTARFVDKVSGYFVAAVITISIGAFFYFLDSGFWHAWDRIIAFIVVTCPCALGIATPVTLSLANANAAKRGVLFRSPAALENLSDVKEVIFDKTGTLTTGKLGLCEIKVIKEENDGSNFWDIVYSLESVSKHPVGRALYQSAKENSAVEVILCETIEVEGKGVTGHKGSAGDDSFKEYSLGSLVWLRNRGVFVSPEAAAFIEERNLKAETLSALSSGTDLIAIFSFSDSIRMDAKLALSRLRALDLKLGILSGDSQSTVKNVAASLAIKSDSTSYEMSPEDKLNYVKAKGKRAAFIGDGINDAPAIKNAGVGIAIGGGAEVSMRCADIFLAKPDLMLLSLAFKGARKTLSLIRRHLAISLFYNLTAGTLALMGLIGPLAAAFVMPASSLTVILSSIMSVPFKEERE